MVHKHLDYYLKYLKQDIPAGIVVFLVALPLCLGIALASGAPLFAGLIAGMVGGLVVSLLSGSELSVSGPAAGLTVIVFSAIEQLGSFQGFLVSVVLAGILQCVLGFLRAGIIGAFFPSAVIKGMLAAIGLILIIKQIPHAVGYDVSFEGDESYMLETASSSFQELIASFSAFSPGATLVAAVSLLILIVWECPFFKRFSWVKLFPGALVAVIWGVLFNLVASKWFPDWAVSGKHLVSLPVTDNFEQFIQLFSLPDFSFLGNLDVYTIAVTLAIIASLESLLCLEAVDKLDPLKRTAPPNRELKAQGIGNIVSGMLGGLPITTVIVRSSANINAGGRTRVASFVHGVLLLMSVMYLTHILNLIPLACLAAILLHTGYKLAKPQMFMTLYHQGSGQFIPFIVTIIAILLTDLLQGIFIGIIVGLFFVIRANYHASITLEKIADNQYRLSLNKDVSFLNKPLLRNLLLEIDENSTVIIDANKAQFVDQDILETLEDFIISAPDSNIKVVAEGLQRLEKQSAA
jgi:MFS superfamily sulfate permease-like transporter